MDDNRLVKNGVFEIMDMDKTGKEDRACSTTSLSGLHLVLLDTLKYILIVRG